MPDANVKIILIEQYKLYVEMMDRVTARRGQSNQFYLSIITALLGVIIVFSDENSNIMHADFLFLLASVIGIILCLSWLYNIDSYRQLNKIKFRVIEEIEEDLEFHCYKREWEIEKKEPIKYRRISSVERIIPIIMGGVHFILSVYMLYRLIW